MTSKYSYARTTTNSWLPEDYEVDYDLPFVQPELPKEAVTSWNRNRLSMDELATQEQSTSPSLAPLLSSSTQAAPEREALIGPSPSIEIRPSPHPHGHLQMPSTHSSSSSSSSSDTVTTHPGDPFSNFLRHPGRRSSSIGISPLNPAATAASSTAANAVRTPSPSPFTAPGAGTHAYITRFPSEEARAFSFSSSSSPVPGPSSAYPQHSGSSRGSMILYRRQDLPDNTHLPPLPPPPRASLYSTSGDSFLSVSGDSRYPSPSHGIIAYAYDPTLDADSDPSPDPMHDPRANESKGIGDFSWRGFFNVSTLTVLLAATICLFVVYPVVSFYRSNGVNERIARNSRINATGQAAVVSFDRRGRSQVVFDSDPGTTIDPDTPIKSRTQRSRDGTLYTLVFSDEFEVSGRSFKDDDDPMWITDLRDSSRVSTREGRLVISHAREEWGRRRRSAGKRSGNALRSQRVFCLARGYVEVGVVARGGNESTPLYYTSLPRDHHLHPKSPDNRIPPASSTFLDLSVHISLGLPSTTHSESESELDGEDTKIDYIRFYEHVDAPRCDSVTAEDMSIELR